MKLWQKVLVVFVGCGFIGASSFLISQKPDLMLILSSLNVAVSALTAYLTGFKPTT